NRPHARRVSRTYNGSPAALLSQPIGFSCRLRHPCHTEHILCTATNFQSLVDRVRLSAIDNMGSPHFTSEFELRVNNIQRNDFGRTSKTSCTDCAQADTSTANHHDC